MIGLESIGIQVDKVARENPGPEWSKKKFPYPHHRLYYVTHGSASLTLNDSVHEMVPGYIYLLPAFSLVETICDSHIGHWYCHFRLLNEDVLDIFSIYKPSLKLRAPDNAEDLFHAMLTNYSHEHPFSVLTVQSAILSLLTPFFKDCLQPSGDFLRFEPVLNYIDCHLDEGLSNRNLASLLDLDTVYFSNLFAKTIGLPPNQYIIKKRLEKAQTLLISTELKAKDIAMRTGFENPMYFSYLFKKKVGMTPIGYRKQYRG